MDHQVHYYQEQLEALQGVWQEQDGKRQCWIICGNIAETPTPYGRSTRHYTLTEGPNSELQWGVNGKYTLDPQFSMEAKVASWQSQSGRTEFSWKFLHANDDRESTLQEIRRKGTSEKSGPQETREVKEAAYHASDWKPQLRHRATPDWSKGGAGKSHAISENLARSTGYGQWPPYMYGVDERRMDPSDSRFYTFQEMRIRYSDTYRKYEVEAYWEQECIPETMVDMSKGKGKGKPVGKAYWHNPEFNYMNAKGNSASKGWGKGEYLYQSQLRMKGKGKHVEDPNGMDMMFAQGKSKGKSWNKGYSDWYGDFETAPAFKGKGKGKSKASKSMDDSKGKGKSKGKAKAKAKPKVKAKVKKEVDEEEKYEEQDDEEDEEDEKEVLSDKSESTAPKDQKGSKAKGRMVWAKKREEPAADEEAAGATAD